MSRAPVLVTLGLALFARAAAAAPCEDPSALRADLQRESARADHWNLAWRIVYTTTAAAQLGVAVSGAADHDNTQALWVGGAKSSIAAISHWLSPLEVDVPAATGDACADRSALRAAAERAARDERRAFWLAHIGGLVLNAGGAVVLAERTSWKAGLVSFATGYAVGLIDAYTMPRASWERIREPAWTANVVAAGGRYTLVVGASF